MQPPDLSTKRGRRRKSWSIPQSSPWNWMFDYVQLVLGTLVLAYSFNVFLAPYQIASGGVAGISVLLQHLLGIEPAYTQWALNIPLFILGYFLLGGRSSWKTALGTVLLPLLVYLTRGVEPITTNPLLASVFGGLGTGLGLGIVFRSRGTTGGLSLAAKIIQKYTGISLGLAIAIMDGMVIIGAGLTFTIEQALYALIALFVTSKTIDVVQMGLSYSKVAFIISDERERMEQAILHELDRGMTKLPGYGGYTGQDKTVYMVVIGQTEVTKLKSLVRKVDEQAFIIISDTHEVLGEGFTQHAD